MIAVFWKVPICTVALDTNDSEKLGVPFLKQKLSSLFWRRNQYENFKSTRTQYFGKWFFYSFYVIYCQYIGTYF
jgi:hypothetical protein